MTPAVVATGLVKEFEKGRHTVWQRLRGNPDQRTRFRAVDGIDLRVETGEIFGLLGPNGAGKTTTMKMLSTLLEPTSGTIEVLGIDVARRPREVRAKLGAMLSGERSLYWKLTARENLEYFAALYHVPPQGMRERIEKALAAVKLSDRADDYVERYSTGMRQRLALARALLPDPPLVILDEPTVGLDPQSARDLRDRVRDLRTQGRTVLLTTHYMEEADQLCDRVAIIDKGKLLALDTPTALKAQAPGETIIDVTLDRTIDGELPPLAGVTRAEARGAVLRAYAESAASAIPALLAVAESRGYAVRDIHLSRPSLETLFISLTGRKLA